MALFRCAFSIAKPALLIPKNPNSNAISLNVIMAIRSISSLEVTKNITLLTNDKNRQKIVNMQLVSPRDKPLVVMWSWMMARRKHIVKYADIYIQKGFDVINISVSPWQLLWPIAGTQVVAKDVIRFLDANRAYSSLMVHGFSVGGYAWSEVLVEIDAQKPKYQHILDRIAGQVWDSAADITELPKGLPFAMFPRNKVLQLALKQYIIYHLKTFDKVATCHYMRGSQMFHTTIVRAPALFFISKTDAIGTERSNARVRSNWENMGIETYWKCWDKSPHVGHYRQHPEEYTEELVRFIDRIGLGQFQEAKAKL